MLHQEDEVIYSKDRFRHSNKECSQNQCLSCENELMLSANLSPNSFSKQESCPASAVLDWTDLRKESLVSTDDWGGGYVIQDEVLYTRHSIVYKVNFMTERICFYGKPK